MIKLLKIVRQILKEQDELDPNKPVNLDDEFDSEEQDKKEPELKPIDPTGAGTIDINSPLEPEFNEPEEEEDEPEEEITKDISPIDAKNLIKSTKGKFFTVWFVKKDGTLREMNARLAVKAYLKGGELPYNAEEKGLIPCYDVKLQGYRMINWTTIKKLRIGGREYNVK